MKSWFYQHSVQLAQSLPIVVAKAYAVHTYDHLVKALHLAAYI